MGRKVAKPVSLSLSIGTNALLKGPGAVVTPAQRHHLQGMSIQMGSGWTVWSQKGSLSSREAIPHQPQTLSPLTEITQEHFYYYNKG